MKKRGIFIDLTNHEHVKWWNDYARKLVVVVRRENIVETATGKIIGVIMVIQGGLRANRIFKENDKFLQDPVSVTNEYIERYRG